MPSAFAEVSGIDGSPLYRAEWYREPGEDFWGFLSTASPGSGLMACRTIANFYVTVPVVLADDVEPKTESEYPASR